MKYHQNHKNQHQMEFEWGSFFLFPNIIIILWLFDVRRIFDCRLTTASTIKYVRPWISPSSSDQRVNIFIHIPNGLPTDDARDVFDDPTGLMAVSGMCRSSALKKLYNWNENETQICTIML